MVDVADKNVVAILTRAPSAGGKTRLFAELGIAPDPALLAALLLDTAAGATTAHAQQIIAVTPSEGCAEVARMMPGALVVTQSGGTLGDRMSVLMSALFGAGAQAVALIGSDLPDITHQHLADAFAAVKGRSRSLAIGPSRDGGYYLLAATQLPPVFDGIQWGSSVVFEQTIAAAKRAGWYVRVLPVLDDVDQVDDLKRHAQKQPGSLSAGWWRLHGGSNNR